MNKKKIIIETSILSLILVIFYVISFTLILNFSKKNTYSTLVSNSNVVVNLFNGNEEEKSIEELNNIYTSTNDVRVSIIIKENDNKYTILFDNKKMYNAENTPDELNHIDEFYTRKSSYGYNMIYYTLKDDDNGKYYIRTSIKESDATLVSRNFLIYGLPTLIVILVLYVLYKIYDYKKVIKPLQTEIVNLSKISSEEIISTGDSIELLSNSISSIKGDLENKNELLNEEKEKTKLILDSIAEGFLVISSDHKIIMYNKALKNIFLLDESEVINEDYNLLYLGDKFNNEIIDVLNSNKDSNFDLTKDNKTYQVNLTPISLKVDSKDIKAVAIILFDVTENRKLTKIKNDFISNASHELKTPLTTILGYQELIYSGVIKDEDKIKEAIEITINQAKKIKDIITDMLTISKLENVDDNKIENVSILSTINDILKDEKLKIENKNIKVNINDEDFNILANKDDINKLFSNLIDNAIKYNKDNGNIDIIVIKDDKEVKIKDTGIGIKDEDKDRIFERFYRVDNSKLENNVEGTGLGLSIVKHIVDKYSYKIDVDSEYLLGSTFILKLK